METVVTGGTGFVGSNIVRELAEHGHRVLSIDIAEPDDMARRYLSAWPEQVTWAQADILDNAALNQAIDGHDIKKIVHAAVYTAIRDDIERNDSRRIIDINVSGTANILEVARELSVDRFLYVSSGGVYEGIDSSTQPLREDMPVNPRQLYNSTKYTSELITQRYGELHGFETVSVRLGGPYGPMERTTRHRVLMSLMHFWTGKAVRGEPIEIVEDGFWDLTNVLDIAAGIRTVLDAPNLSHEVYNLSRGVSVSLEELMNAFKQARPDVQFVEAKPDGPQTSTSTRRVMDSSRILEDLGFSAQYDLVSGLAQYIKWREEYGYTR